MHVSKCEHCKEPAEKHDILIDLEAIPTSIKKRCHESGEEFKIETAWIRGEQATLGFSLGALFK